MHCLPHKMRSLLSLLRLPLFWYWTARARIQFFVRRVRWPINFEVRGNLGLSSLGNIELGSNVTIISDSKHNRAGINHPTQLVAGAGATLKIGDHVGISGASIYCTEAITIGNHVLIGANSKISIWSLIAIDTCTAITENIHGFLTLSLVDFFFMSGDLIVQMPCRQ